MFAVAILIKHWNAGRVSQRPSAIRVGGVRSAIVVASRRHGNPFTEES